MLTCMTGLQQMVVMIRYTALEKKDTTEETWVAEKTNMVGIFQTSFTMKVLLLLKMKRHKSLLTWEYLLEHFNLKLNKQSQAFGPQPEMNKQITCRKLLVVLKVLLLMNPKRQPMIIFMATLTVLFTSTMYSLDTKTET